MTIETKTKNGAGKEVTTIRIGREDGLILLGLIEQSLKHIPITAQTDKTIQRMKAMHRGLRKWKEENLK